MFNEIASIESTSVPLLRRIFPKGGFPNDIEFSVFLQKVHMSFLFCINAKMLSSFIYLMKLRGYCKLQIEQMFTFEIAALNAAIAVLATVMAVNKIFQIFTVPPDFC